jgi:hypothetical protein
MDFIKIIAGETQLSYNGNQNFLCLSADDRLILLHTASFFYRISFFKEYDY